MRNAILITLLLTAAGIADGVAVGQTKRPFTIEDLYRLTSVDDPQFSPDGKRIAFVVSTTDLHAGKGNSDLYLINSDGSNLRQLTTNPAADNHPRWSPDGTTIYFTSSRKDGLQLWALPLNGGEPRQLTSTSLGMGDPIVTPDAGKVVFSGEIFPESGTDEAANKKLNDGLANGPLQAYMADGLLYRHWTALKEGRLARVLMRDLTSGSTTDLTPGKFDAPAFSLGGTGFTLSPDSKELCYVSNHDPVEAISTNKDLWTVPLTGGEATCITSMNKASDSDPAYSPDGRYIAYLMQAVPGYESDRVRLFIFDRTTGQRRNLTETFDYWVTSMHWAPDSKSIYFTADVKGHIPIYNVELAKGTVTEVVDMKAIDAFSISPDGKMLAIARRSVGDPRELWACTVTGKNIKRLTFFNKEIEETVDIRPAEEIWISSPTGKRIHTFIVKPHGFDPSKKYPLILNVHGGPQTQWADAFRGDWQVYPGSGYIVAFPNPHGSTGYGQEFTEAISRDWGGKVVEDVMAVTDSLAKIPWVDPQRMGAMGWSYGGYMMMWLEGHTTRFKALASMMGVYNLKAMHGATEELWFPEWDLAGTPWESPLYDKWSPNRFVKNFKTPCLVITGERDYRVSYTQSLEFFTDLQRMGVPSRLIVFKNDGHWPGGVTSMPFYYNAHLDWFAKYLGGAPAPYDMTKMLRNQAYGK